MGKLENWSQEIKPKNRRGTNKVASWRNDKTGELVIIEKRSGGGMYDVIMKKPGKVGDSWESFRTREEALEEVRMWMDNHPMGRR